MTNYSALVFTGAIPLPHPSPQLRHVSRLRLGLDDLAKMSSRGQRNLNLTRTCAPHQPSPGHNTRWLHPLSLFAYAIALAWLDRGLLDDAARPEDAVYARTRSCLPRPLFHHRAPPISVTPSKRDTAVRYLQCPATDSGAFSALSLQRELIRARHRPLHVSRANLSHSSLHLLNLCIIYRVRNTDSWRSGSLDHHPPLLFSIPRLGLQSVPRPFHQRGALQQVNCVTDQPGRPTD